MKRLPQGSLLVGAIVAWTVTFCVGISQNSAKFLHVLWDFPYPWSLVCFMATWTWTNVMFLACFASLAGEVGRAVGGNHRPNLIAAAARGFLIYLAFVAGQLVLNGTLPTAEGADPNNVLYVNEAQYFRVAAFASLLAFMAGFNPVFFSSLVTRLERFAAEGQPSAG